MADTNNTDHQFKKTSVELVEISEQLEPLMRNKASPTQKVHKNDIDFNVMTASTEDAMPLTACTASQNEYSSPTHAGDMMAGGIPKTRKRPGSTRDSQCITMTGTVKTGNAVGQPVEVQLELTENEFHRLTSGESQSKAGEKCECGHNQGPHIIMWSILCMPVAMVISACVSFYNGAMTWYNLVVYFSEEKSLLHKLALCPVLILSFPLTVGLSAFLISLTASVMQVSWSWHWWWTEICDGEKGFYGWFCNKVRLPTCSPYEVVVLDGNCA